MAQYANDKDWIRVSIHAPARGATHDDGHNQRRELCFNPRARAGRDAGSRWLSTQMTKIGYAFQSTRPRGARLTTTATTSAVNYVSIHAPARGATAKHGCTIAVDQSTVSIHAPARGATRIRASRAIGSMQCFNPRARAGRDGNALRHGHDHDVSIHAPARGATDAANATIAGTRCFNPRARAGRDAQHGDSRSRPTCFNPRARAGRDRRWSVACSAVAGFNPRARAGRDARAARTASSTNGFNPRARAGRDAVDRWQLTALDAFQSTRPRGARQIAR